MEEKIKKFNVEKQNIINAIQNDDKNVKIEEKVEAYLNKYPGDTDIIIVKAYMELINDIYLKILNSLLIFKTKRTITALEREKRNAIWLMTFRKHPYVLNL